MGLLNKLRRSDSAEKGAASTHYLMVTSFARDHNLTGLELMRQGLYRDALEEFRLALRDMPDSAETYYNMGVIYDYLSDLKKAVACYERAVRIAPDFVEAHSGLGLVYSKMGKGVEAIKSCLQAIRLDPNCLDAYNNLALSYFHWGSYPEAIKACNKALAVDPNYSPARYTLGLVYVDLGSKEQALDQHVLLQDSDPELAEHLLSQIPR
jgi:tetratricopeptide (TPR) repeat protein